MGKLKYLAVIALATLCVPSVVAQTREALKINEVMVENQTSAIDDYGERHGWIELFNGNFAPLEISTVFLTNDSTNKTMYPVPIGDVKTLIEKRQHVIFYADGQPNKGTFHISFTLTPGQENWIGLYDTDGKLLDQVTVPATMAADNSYARVEDGVDEWSIRTGGEQDYITPCSANVIRDGNEQIALFSRMDKHGFGMALMAMGIVFSALLVLCLCFAGISKVGAYISRLNKRRAMGATKEELAANNIEAADSGEEIAAIVMAIHEHFNAHDTESTVLTINKVKRAYSPWSSKIYGLRVVPERQSAK